MDVNLEKKRGCLSAVSAEAKTQKFDCLKAARRRCIGCQVGVHKSLILIACLKPNLKELTF